MSPPLVACFQSSHRPAIMLAEVRRETNRILRTLPGVDTLSDRSLCVRASKRQALAAPSPFAVIQHNAQPDHGLVDRIIEAIEDSFNLGKTLLPLGFACARTQFHFGEAYRAPDIPAFWPLKLRSAWRTPDAARSAA